MGKSKTVILLILIFLLAGCNAQGRLEESKSKVNEKKDKIPTPLTSMDDSIHRLIENIEQIEDVREISPEDIKPQNQPQPKEEEKGKEGETPEENDDQAQPAMVPSNNNEDQEKTIEQEKEAQILEKWKGSEDQLKTIHEAWNDYESTALKDGADTGKIEQMERALNSLTSHLELKNKDESLIEANNIILALSNFLDLYRGNADGTLRKIEYMARQSYMDSKEGLWEDGQEKVKKGEEHISALRQRVEIKEEHKALLEKLNLSIKDLQMAINEENLKLLEIKRDIVIKNIESLVDEL